MWLNAVSDPKGVRAPGVQPPVSDTTVVVVDPAKLDPPVTGWLEQPPYRPLCFRGASGASTS